MTALEDALDSIIGAGVKTFEMNLGTLSPREAEICEQIIKGRSSKQIAELLNVSVSTIHKHRESVRRKLQVQNQDINLSTYLRNNKNR